MWFSRVAVALAIDDVTSLSCK